MFTPLVIPSIATIIPASILDDVGVVAVSTPTFTTLFPPEKHGIDQVGVGGGILFILQEGYSGNLVGKKGKRRLLI